MDTSANETTTQPVGAVTRDLTGRCAVLYKNETDGTITAKAPRDFPPRRTYPVAIVGLDGDITRLTGDPLPDNKVLTQAIAALRAANPDALPSVSFDERLERLMASPGSGVPVPRIVAFDVSASADSPVEQWVKQAYDAGARVLLFDGDVVEYQPGAPVEAPLGGAGLELLESFIDNLGYGVSPYVLVVTDGYTPHVRPRRPRDWAWAITRGGDPWPARAASPMSTVNLT